MNKLVQKHQVRKDQEEAQLTEELAQTATKEEIKAFTDLSAKDKQQLLDAARKVHINTGHQPPSELAKLLRKNGAPLASRAAMEQVKCSTCQEHQRPQPSPVASLSTASQPWKVLGMDIKEYNTSKEKLKYLLFVDECTRLVRCKLLFSTPINKFRNATSPEIIRVFEEEWEEIFGCPEVLRHDSEGAMVSAELIQAMCEKGIRVTATAGEAHWQLGITERSIQTVFNTAEKIRDELKIPMEKAVTLAVKAHNTCERIHGYTPSQWAFGRNPSWDDTLHEQPEATVNISRDGNEMFQQKLQQQITARKIFEEEILRQKVQRAARAKHRRDLVLSQANSSMFSGWGLGK